MTQYNPPPGAGGPAGAGSIPNYLVQSIIAIFCCWPLAIPAIIFATQVNSKVAAGDIAGAQESSAKAKKFSMIAIVLGLIWIAIYVILMVTGVVGGVTAANSGNM